VKESGFPGSETIPIIVTKPRPSRHQLLAEQLVQPSSDFILHPSSFILSFRRSPNRGAHDGQPLDEPNGSSSRCRAANCGQLFDSVVAHDNRIAPRFDRMHHRPLLHRR
jgi:hypothetical protein